LTSVTIPDSAIGIGVYAFSDCKALTSVTIGNSIKNIGDFAFLSCRALTRAYFAGDEPTIGLHVFHGSSPTVYYLANTMGWVATFGERPTARFSWPKLIDILPPSPPGDPLALFLAGDTNMLVAVQACTQVSDPDWIDVGAVTLTDGTVRGFQCAEARIESLLLNEAAGGAKAMCFPAPGLVGDGG
jgi:hypothetical protein